MNFLILKSRRLLFLFGMLLLASCSYLLTPKVETRLNQLKLGQYKLDPAHTSVIFKVSHMGLSTFVGRFNRMDGELIFDPADLLKTRLSAFVETASVDVNNNELSQDLAGSSWFNSQDFPQASLRTLKVESLPQENQFIMHTELTLLGVSRPLLLNATFHGGANNMLTGYYTLGFSAVGELKRADYGLDSYIPMVGDNVSIEVYAEFQKR